MTFSGRSSASSVLDENEEKYRVSDDTNAIRAGFPRPEPALDAEPVVLHARPRDAEEAGDEKSPVLPQAFEASSAPDGGFEAWLVVAGGWACLFCSFGWINCIGVFQNYYQHNQLKHLSPSAVSWIPSLEVFMMFIGGPIIGKGYDSFGPRYILLVGSFFHVFGLMMTSISLQYYQFILAQGICSAIGASAIFYAAMGSVSTWFYRHRALSFGVVASGSSLGGVIFPIMVQRLIPEVGFGWAMRITALLILALLMFANVTVKSRLAPSPSPVNLMEFITPLQEYPFLFTTCGGLLFAFGMFLPINYVIVHGIRLGMSARLSGYLVPILNAASIFGRIIPGWIGDRIGRFNAMIIMASFSGIIVLALWLPSSGSIPIIIFSALFGFGSGAYVSLAPALIAQISDIRKIGVRTGTLFAVVSIGALCGNPIGGALISADHGGFMGLQIFSGVMMIAGAVFFFLARANLVGTIAITKV